VENLCNLEKVLDSARRARLAVNTFPGPLRRDVGASCRVVEEVEELRSWPVSSTRAAPRVPSRATRKR